jgi:hypothetical protein
VSGFSFLAAPGSVPDISLRVSPSTVMPGDLALSWGAATSAGGDAYYLVAPVNTNDEGSYGRGSNGVERPQGALPFKALQDLSCP